MGERLKRLRGGKLRMGGEGAASKSSLEFSRSKADGEFLRVTISRRDPDDQCRWSMHFALDQAVFIAVSLLLILPPKALLATFSRVIEARPDVQELLKAANAEPEVTP